MNERRTTSILQRLPVILAVTAASYGLRPQGKTKPPEGGSVPSGKRQPQLQVAGGV
ncbi:MAG: hypothetical protein Q8R01_16500 [Ramlibacter sp.]|nr:hypothetical protein [Ramlibacter sp.]